MGLSSSRQLMASVELLRGLIEDLGPPTRKPLSGPAKGRLSAWPRRRRGHSRASHHVGRAPPRALGCARVAVQLVETLVTER
jgi:hypothetical protein